MNRYMYIYDRNLFSLCTIKKFCEFRSIFMEKISYGNGNILLFDI